MNGIIERDSVHESCFLSSPDGNRARTYYAEQEGITGPWARALGTYVRERRLHLELSQAQLARRVGKPYSQADVSRLERGDVDLPRLGTLIKLAAALEVPVGNLLIVSGWFTDEHFAFNLTSGKADERDTLITVLSEIES
jgi:transcriptional regulator with XRE-family HTH domain